MRETMRMPRNYFVRIICIRFCKNLALRPEPCGERMSPHRRLFGAPRHRRFALYLGDEQSENPKPKLMFVFPANFFINLEMKAGLKVTAVASMSVKRQICSRSVKRESEVNHRCAVETVTMTYDNDNFCHRYRHQS